MFPLCKDTSEQKENCSELHRVAVANKRIRRWSLWFQNGFARVSQLTTSVDKNGIDKLVILGIPLGVSRARVHCEPLVPDPPDPTPLEVEIATAKLKRYKSPGSDQIPAETFENFGGLVVSLTKNSARSLCWSVRVMVSESEV
jgi:hypothetical protein